jgi:hypothetical protein
VLPMIVGSVGQLADVPAAAHGKAVSLTLTLLARRSADRAGTRHWRRGADTTVSAAATLHFCSLAMHLLQGQIQQRAAPHTSAHLRPTFVHT